MRDVLTYAIAAYGFLLTPDIKHTGKQFAELVKGYFSLENPRNKAIYEALDNSDGIFIRRWW